MRLKPGSSAIRRGRPTRVTLRYGPPGATSPHTKVVSLNLERLPAPPVPHILNLRATRHGTALILRWDTDLPALDLRWYVVGAPVLKGGRAGDIVSALIEGKGKRHFAARLKAAAKVRFVRVTGIPLSDRKARSQILRIVG